MRSPFDLLKPLPLRVNLILEYRPYDIINVGVARESGRTGLPGLHGGTDCLAPLCMESTDVKASSPTGKEVAAGC